MKTETVIYTGRHGAVDVPCPDGREETVAWDGTLTTTPEHAASLLEQPDNWKPAPTRATGTQKQAAKPAEQKEA